MHKIAYFLNALDIGGTCKTAYLFAKYLKYKVTFFTYKDADLTRLPQISQFAEVVLLDRKNPNFTLLEQYDIVHVFQSGHGNEAPRPGVHFTKGRNAKFIIHNVFGEIDTNPQIDADIFMSEWMLDKSYHKRLVLNRELNFVNNPVERPFINAKLKLDLSEDTVILGHISRPDPGLFDGLSTDACKILLNRNYKIHYLALSPPENLVQALTKLNIPSTIIASSVDESILWSYYNTVDIMLWDRIDGETGGSCIQEQQMAGKPIIVCPAEPKHLGMSVWQNQLECVQHNKTGFHARRNAEDYAKKIELLINNPELRWDMGLAAKEWAMNNYHTSVTVSKLENIYEKMFFENPHSIVPCAC